MSTPITDEQRQTFYQDACRYWDQECDRMGYEGDKPQNVQRRFQAILAAADLDTATQATQKAKECSDLALLSLWADKKIFGPKNPRSLMKRVKKAESLARMLEGKGDLEGAASQRKRAQEYKEEADQMKKSLTDPKK